jgi:hypothetical protein
MFFELWKFNTTFQLIISEWAFPTSRSPERLFLPDLVISNASALLSVLPLPSTRGLGSVHQFTVPPTGKCLSQGGCPATGRGVVSLHHHSWRPTKTDSLGACEVPGAGHMRDVSFHCFGNHVAFKNSLWVRLWAHWTSDHVCHLLSHWRPQASTPSTKFKSKLKKWHPPHWSTWTAFQQWSSSQSMVWGGQSRSSEHALSQAVWAAQLHFRANRCYFVVVSRPLHAMQYLQLLEKLVCLLWNT